MKRREVLAGIAKGIGYAAAHTLVGCSARAPPIEDLCKPETTQPMQKGSNIFFAPVGTRSEYESLFLKLLKGAQNTHQQSFQKAGMVMPYGFKVVEGTYTSPNAITSLAPPTAIPEESLLHDIQAHYNVTGNAAVIGVVFQDKPLAPLANGIVPIGITSRLYSQAREHKGTLLELQPNHPQLVGGCNTSSLYAARVAALAHEIGHTLGRSHQAAGLMNERCNAQEFFTKADLSAMVKYGKEHIFQEKGMLQRNNCVKEQAFLVEKSYIL